MADNKSSLLRYPGGKQRILSWLLKYLPSKELIQGKYIEPFIGGAAVFLKIKPTKAVISDINPELINLYKGIQNGPKELWEIYKSFPNDKEGYYHIRDNTPINSDLIYRAARTLYLNRTCFKGMWRHNSNGNFNVGYGGESRRWKICLKDLIHVSNLLKSVTILCADFKKTISNANEGDFVFLDPPYSASKSKTTHDHYLYGTFNKFDQMRLASVLREVSERGVHWAMTNSNHDEILQHYRKYHIRYLCDGHISYKGQVLIVNY